MWGCAPLGHVYPLAGEDPVVVKCVYSIGDDCEGECSLANEVAVEYILDNSWYRPHWKESTADASRLPSGVGRP
jgi:hypothetical protein